MGQSVFSVTEAIRRVNRVLDRQVRHVAVRGELSGVKRASSGHIYFRLKDDDGVLDAAFFRHRAAQLGYPLRDGIEVICRGPLTIFAPQGRIQMVVEDLELVGVGALAIAFERLMSRLAQEGLFNPEHKKPLPDFPRRIALITSPTGAALRDLLHVLQRRNPSCSILIAACQVQGRGASSQIVDRIQAVNAYDDVDLIILGRGGGSIEDLWAFNEEKVARAIYASRIPILTGIGHETDFTISDFVSDKRAPTPSAAAEIAVTEEAEWREQIQEFEMRLTLAVRRIHQEQVLMLQSLRGMLRPPQRHLLQQRRKLESFQKQLEQGVRGRLQQENQRRKQLQHQLETYDPRTRLARYQQHNVALAHRLRHLMERLQQQQRHRLAQLAQRLNDLSPLAVLERGYALAYKEDQRLLRDASEAKVGETLTIRLQKGSVQTRVESTDPEPS
ncbi:MAG: exodeoxyribonuclease VII large subunit [Deltaproteobacteria bacterium]|nr:MAG: exodeoxyribonuclease VII large subunit [Deltaproteobacteria bacterium]